MLPHLICPWSEPGELTAQPQQAPWQKIEPVYLSDVVTGVSPQQATSVRTVWNDSEWRVLFDCDDTNVWATMTEHDALLYEEETVEIFFDPVGDLQGYFEIEVNPLNAVLDLVFRKSVSGYKGDRAWNCEGIKTLVKRRPDGWCAEISIPFDSIGNHPSTPSTCWRVNFCRIDRPEGKPGPMRELTAWSTAGRNNFHTPERFGMLEFVR